MEYKDYYAILGVPRNASQADIRKAFRKLARQHHPDVNKGDAAAERRFKEVSEAHEVLGDAEKRKKYDTLGANWEQFQQAGRAGAADPFAGFRTAGSGPGGGGIRFEYHGSAEDLSGFSDFFRTFFSGTRQSRVRERERVRRRAEDAAADREWEDLLAGLGGADLGGPGAGGAGTSGRARARTGPDVEAEAEIGLEEAFAGTERLVQVDDRRLRVTIPAGVESGQRIRLRGQAGAGPDGGDVYLRVALREHPVFTRSGADLHRELPLTLGEALLGAEVPVETISGRVMLRIPPETQNGRVFRLGGQGMPRFRKEGRGDLYVKVRVILPANLDERARELARALVDYVRQPDPRSASRQEAWAGAH